MSKRRAPRPLAEALGFTKQGLAPQTPLGQVQAAWAEAVGDKIARVARPVSEARGVITVACESGVWAQQLDLLSGDILGRLTDLTGSDEGFSALKFTIDADSSHF